MLKLLIHVPDSTRAKIASKMAINFLKTRREGEEMKVRVLFNAQGVTVLLENDEELMRGLEEITKQGGEVYFCENALKAFDVERDKVPSFAGTVPAGIRVLVEWQDDGFRYVRA
ncbi:MAG: hypothetical protein GXO17_01595 [Thermodesulfobacteria bacterium]|nr:hypothetical protein [Thermodesulfobacteriota bacterium]